MMGGVVFFFNDTATTEIYTLSLHDALPIFTMAAGSNTFPFLWKRSNRSTRPPRYRDLQCIGVARSEEHTSELQSRQYLVCRLLLEKNNPTHFTRSSCIFISRFPYSVRVSAS